MADLFLIPYVRTLWRMLDFKLGVAGRLYLFGAGDHTRWLLSVTKDLPRPPIVCILDDDPAEASLCGIPVRPAAEVRVAPVDVILVSSDKWEDKLAQRARELWGDHVEVVRLYEGLPPGPYDKTDDRIEALECIRNRRNMDATGSREVVIVSDQPRAREAKIAYGLRHAGCRPVLLHQRPPSFDPSEHFDAVRCYTNGWQALRLACEYSPLAYHVFVNSDYRVAELFLRHRPGLVVVDSYDLIAGMYSDEFLAAHPDFEAEMARERFCLEEADGLCCRSREADLLEERFGYALADRVLLPDGCWNRPLPPQQKPDGGLHTAYAGHVPIPGGKRRRFASHGSKFWLARTLARQGVHFHLYPAATTAEGAFDRTFSAYRDLEGETSFFHLHRPVPPERLVEELAAYDLAVFVYNELVEPANTTRTYTEEKFKLATANKLFDFIDAGLPVVHTAVQGSFIAGLLDEHDIRIEVGDVPPDTWAELLGSLDLGEWRERVRRAREAYDIRRNVHELIRFYQGPGKSRPIAPPAIPVRNKEGHHADDRSEHREALV